MKEEQILQIIPKAQDYIEYMIEVIIRIPRTEKFTIGTEYKNSMYKMLNDILYLRCTINKIGTLNNIDAELNMQRICLRIMYKYRWIDIKKFNVAVDKIGEIGKILGGLIKYYDKDNKK